VVSDQRRARNGAHIEVIGHYNPRTRPSTDLVDEARALYWLSVGAQPTDSLVSIFKRTGTWERYMRLKQGEPLDKLVAEADAAKVNAAAVSPKTSYPSPAEGQSYQKAKEAAANTPAEGSTEGV
jgi:small subunit ribosomal protein S16